MVCGGMPNAAAIQFQALYIKTIKTISIPNKNAAPKSGRRASSCLRNDQLLVAGAVVAGAVVLGVVVAGAAGSTLTALSSA